MVTRTATAEGVFCMPECVAFQRLDGNICCRQFEFSDKTESDIERAGDDFTWCCNYALHHKDTPYSSCQLFQSPVTSYQ